MEDWILSRTESDLEIVKEEAQEFFGRLRNQINKLRSVSEDLLNESEENLKRDTRGGKYRASRSARRLARSISTSLGDFNLPEGSSYDEMKTLSDTLPRILSRITSARQRWEDQTNPFFLLTMRRLRIEYDRLVELRRELIDFLENRYDKARKVEETIEMITEIEELRTEANDILGLEEKARREVAKLDSRFGIYQERITELERSPIAIELRSTEEEVEKAESRIYSRLSSLQRPLKKMKFLVKKGQLDISPETNDILRRIKERIDVHQIEQIGMKPFYLLMDTMREAVEGNHIPLKKEERTRVIETLDALLDEKIIEVELDERKRNEDNRETLLLSKEGKEYKDHKLDLEREKAGLKEERLRSLEELGSIKNRLEESQASIEGIKERIEMEIRDLLGEEIDIRVG